MKLVTLCLAFVVASISAGGLAAQEKPNFSGVWVSGDGPQAGRAHTIKQDDSKLTVDFLVGSEATLNLDGEVTTLPGPDGKPILVTVVWKGNALVMTFHSPEIKQDFRRQTWTLDGAGQLTMYTEFLGPAAMSGGLPRLPVREMFKRR